MADPIAWEYKVLSGGSIWSAPKDENLEAILNQLGAENWEVLAVYEPPGGKLRIVAKRPLTTRSRRSRSMPGMDE